MSLSGRVNGRHLRFLNKLGVPTQQTYKVLIQTLSTDQTFLLIGDPMLNLSEYSKSQSPLFDRLKPMMASADAAGHILSDAARSLLTIQSELAATSFAKALTRLVPAFAPGDRRYTLWQLHADYQVEAERWVSALMESMGVLSRVQQQMYELQGELLTLRVHDTAQAIARVNGVLASRRHSAEVINFSDRRAESEAQSLSQAKTTTEVQQAASPRARNQAAG